MRRAFLLAASAAGQDTGPPLLVGKFVEVAIEGLVPDEYFSVRRAALQADDEVWVVRDDGTVRVVPVRVLQRIDDDVYVTGELEDGQLAVTGGIRFATQGMQVRTGEARGRETGALGGHRPLLESLSCPATAIRLHLAEASWGRG